MSNDQYNDGASTSAAYNKPRSALDDFVAQNYDWRSASEEDSSLNFSDHADEDTIDINTPGRQRMPNGIVATVESPLPVTSAAASSVFEPSEMTGRSTECCRTSSSSRPTNHPIPSYASSVRLSMPADGSDGDRSLLLSTEEILSQSMAEEVRQMAVGLSQLKVRHSCSIGAAGIVAGSGRQSNASYATSLANTADMSFESQDDDGMFLAGTNIQ